MGYVLKITCDKCGDGWVYHDGGHSYPGAVKIYRQWYGWQIGKTGWYCPKCRSRKRRGSDVRDNMPELRQ